MVKSLGLNLVYVLSVRIFIVYAFHHFQATESFRTYCPAQSSFRWSDAHLRMIFMADDNNRMKFASTFYPSTTSLSLLKNGGSSGDCEVEEVPVEVPVAVHKTCKGITQK